MAAANAAFFKAVERQIEDHIDCHLMSKRDSELMASILGIGKATIICMAIKWASDIEFGLS